jgi:hypothetical protein
VATIRCEEIDIQNALAGFPAVRASFPIKYLGLPITLGRLRRCHLQSYVDKALSRLNPWKAKFLNRAVCMALVKSVLTSMHIYLLTALKLDKATMKSFDKISRGMLWACSSSVSGGKSKVCWAKVCRPKDLGGLGILDLEKFARALRLRWLWFEWTTPDKPWVGLQTPNDETDRSLFSAATRVSLGDGHKASFWHSSWLDGMPPKLVVPLIYEVSKRKKRTVHDALANNRWIADVAVTSFTVEHMTEFITLWDMLQNVALLPGTPDAISWTLTADGIYSAGSAYKAQFQGATSCSFKQIV